MIMLPLNTCLLFTCALEQTFIGKARQVLLIVLLVLLSLSCSIQAISFREQLLDLSKFPDVMQGIDPEEKALCDWVRYHTPKNAVVVSPPVELTDFTWIAERPTVAKFKLFPQINKGWGKSQRSDVVVVALALC